MYQYKTIPYNHQREALRKGAALTAFAWLMEQGTGKSKVCIDNVGWLYEKAAIDCFIIIAPNGIHQNWIKNEIPAHLPDTIPCVTTVWASGSARAQRLMHKAAIDKRLVIASFNIDCLGTDDGLSTIKDLCTSRRVLMAIDESSDIAHPSSARTRAAWKLARLAKYRRILDGTPFAESPMEAYAQFRFLDPNILGFQRFQHYKEYVAVWRDMTLRGNDGKSERVFKVQVKDKDGHKVWRKENIERIKERMAPFIYRVLKKDVLDLPERVYARRPIELSAQQRTLYDQLTLEWETQLSNGMLVTVDNKLTMMVRHQQIACGYVPSAAWFAEEETEPAHIIPGPTPRLEAALELYQHYPVPTIIWARFSKDIELLAETFKKHNINTTLYNGSIGAEERARNMDHFLSGEADVILCNARLAGRGHTMNRARHAIYYSNYFSSRLRIQSEDRFHRIGQMEKVLVTDIEAINTCDERVRAALRSKKSISDMMTGDPSFEWLA